MTVEVNESKLLKQNRTHVSEPLGEVTAPCPPEY